MTSDTETGDCSAHASPSTIACGWAFDAGMREAERDRSLTLYEELLSREWRKDREHAAAIAAERARCATAVRDYRHDMFGGCSPCDVATGMGCAVCDLLAEIESGHPLDHEAESGAPAPRENA